MRSTFTQLYVHCVWATWDRLPLITPAIQPVLYAAIGQSCQQLNGTVLALGGIEDHVHLLVSIPPTLCVSALVKAAKGSSSHLITHEIESSKFFKWQGSYGAFTVSKTDVETVVEYINNQNKHHQTKSTIPLWELPDPAQILSSG
jgi:putative transposase